MSIKKPSPRQFLGLPRNLSIKKLWSRERLGKMQETVVRWVLCNGGICSKLKEPRQISLPPAGEQGSSTNHRRDEFWETQLSAWNLTLQPASFVVRMFGRVFAAFIASVVPNQTESIANPPRR